MASESTPLRGASPRRDIGQELRRRRLAGLAVFAVVIVAVAFWVSISASRQAHEAAKPEPIKVKDVPTANTSEPATPVPVDATKAFTCGTAANEAGYIKLPNKQDDHYFYWFFESRSKPSEDPLVLWLTGGAGCSSIMALLTENGPCTVNEDLTTMLNPYSWNTEANVIWLDQPTNVGFSYGVEADLDYNEDDVQESIYWFLHRFLDKHPEFEGRPFFITGESYAGHYIPAAAHYIWLENKAIEESNATVQAASAANGTSAGNATARINLQGIAIGNGLVNPIVQFPHFLDMTDNAYNVTLLNDTELAKAKAIIPECEDTLYACQVDSSACFDAEATCNELVTALTGANRSMFDIREECYFGATGDNCQGTNMTTVTRYLNSEPVKAYLNISEHSAPWELCTPRVGEDFAGDEGKNFAPYVADLLNDDAVRVLVYNGDADMMCNWYGGLAWTQQLEWKHQKEFNAAKERAFVVTGKDQEPVNAGTIHAFRDQLTFLRVFNSGHMVPHDQPLVALDMISRFIKNEAL